MRAALRAAAQGERSRCGNLVYVKLKVVHDLCGREILVRQILDSQGHCPWDGKPFSKPTDTGVAKAVVSASTQGDTVVIMTTQPWGGMPGNASLEIKEVWSLSADGKVLTVTTNRNTPALQNSFKTVYNKK